jgi:2-haloacid dehalogenase
MSSSISRREFVLAASSLGSVMMVDQLNALAKVTKGESDVLPSKAVVMQPQTGGRQMKPRVLAFDVNQTLLDLNALRPHFARAFGDGKVLDEWFSLLLQYSLVVTVANAYADFGTVGRAALEMLAGNKKIQIPPEDKTLILQGILTLPPHPEISENLKRLREAGFHMITLTNSSPTAVKSQLQNAKLTEYFEESITVDSVRRFKPDTEVYRTAAAHLGARPDEILLIAAHAWDVFGAMKAGWRAAFIAREGITPFPLGPKPDIVGPDLKVVADAILKI